MRFVLIAALALWPGVASAACTCACIDGHDRSLCDRGTDVPAACGFHACGAVPLGGPPIGGPITAPIGRTACRMAQVSVGSGYAWKRVCR